ncbi:hypothetical protein W97_08200 [Coniosporium apollinis CBS 100218]|uniref:FAD dependent oxidoreductase domain-containing protein n=1 Tax=Coniosporium apollinis (strain CBS 100218) TaxID=1168221 RepID=R7Z448_CONA1|nr:uncharacterized protein W97_08200 [Coniosporium apollinis CBS 100218]EON68942.1 hypothetical protein W97_08200 [Coniosporium apollinis CBS 100218]
MKELTHDSSILIIGGGTWGCSAALELARRGYKNITVLEGHPIPSPIAAGNDVNKIMEEAEPSPNDTDEEYVWSRIHQLSTHAWRSDPLFKPFYHPTGLILSAVTDPVYAHVLADIRREAGAWTPLTSPTDFRATMPSGVLNGAFPRWRGFWKRQGCGWVFARGALVAAYEEARRLGVRFVTGDPQGRVEGLVHDSAGAEVLGVRTADGAKHLADRTVLAAGANSDLLLDFEKQLRPTAWTLSHVPLTEEEAGLCRELPVLFNAERGFFIEPDAEKRELKVCDEHPGYCNFVIGENGEMRSVPFARQQIPVEAAERAHQLLRDTIGGDIPEREFSFARICWDADTVDRIFLIDRHPRYRRLVVAVGGSGNGFMNMPAVGLLVADALEDRMEPRLKKMLRWRPEIAVDRDWWDTQGRFGGEYKVMDFKDVKEWTNVGGITDKVTQRSLSDAVRHEEKSDS